MSAFLAGSFSYWKSYGGVFLDGTWNSYGSLATVIQAVLVFSFLLQTPCKQSGFGVKTLAYLSDLCFAAYLVSAIFDDMIYSYYFKWGYLGEPGSYRLELFFITIPLVFICSLLLSAVIHGIYGILQRMAAHFQKSKTTGKTGI